MAVALQEMAVLASGRIALGVLTAWFLCCRRRTGVGTIALAREGNVLKIAWTQLLPAAAGQDHPAPILVNGAWKIQAWCAEATVV